MGKNTAFCMFVIILMVLNGGLLIVNPVLDVFGMLLITLCNMFVLIVTLIEVFKNECFE